MILYGINGAHPAETKVEAKAIFSLRARFGHDSSALINLSTAPGNLQDHSFPKTSHRVQFVRFRICCSRLNVTLCSPFSIRCRVEGGNPIFLENCAKVWSPRCLRRKADNCFSRVFCTHGDFHENRSVCGIFELTTLFRIWNTQCRTFEHTTRIWLSSRTLVLLAIGFIGIAQQR